MPDVPPTARTTNDESTGTVLTAFAANLMIAIVKLAAGLIAGSAAMLSEAAHSVADTSNQVFLLVSLRRSARPADPDHPFGYGKERYVWALLAAVGIFVTGACFSFFEGIRVLTGATGNTAHFWLLYVVLAVSAIAEGSSLAKAVRQLREVARQHRRPAHRIALESSDTALATVLAEDSGALAGIAFAAAGLVLHQTTGQAAWEGAASIAIGVLLAVIAVQLGRRNMHLLIGLSADPALRLRAWHYLDATPGVDRVLEVQTMQLSPASVLLAARIDLDPGVDSERIEQLTGALRAGLADIIPAAEGQVFLDISDATADRRLHAERTYAHLREETDEG